AQIASQLEPVHDVAAHVVGVAQQIVDTRKVRRAQSVAHVGAGNAPTFTVRNRIHGFDLESAVCTQHMDVTSALGAKTEIIADLQPAHVQALLEQLCDEVFRPHGRQSGVEALHDDLSYAGRSEIHDLV